MRVISKNLLFYSIGLLGAGKRILLILVVVGYYFMCKIMPSGLGRTALWILLIIFVSSDF